jgi:transposase-like protein
MNVRICPRCNSRDIEMEKLSFALGDRKWRCKSCSFESVLFPEITVKNLGELKKLKVKRIK